MNTRDRANEASNDSELRAMMAIKRYLEPLDRGARHRILKWAEDRFITESIPEVDPAFMTTFTNGLREVAHEMGNITPLDIIRGVNEIARMREEAEETVTP